MVRIESPCIVDDDVIVVRLEPDSRMLVVGAPVYLERHARLEIPGDLEGHVCINYRLVGGGGLRPWMFERDGKREIVRPEGQLIVNDGVLAAAAVRAGAGLGAPMEHEVADELASGRLCRYLTIGARAFRDAIVTTLTATSRLHCGL